jgi:hypothetical protein
LTRFPGGCEGIPDPQVDGGLGVLAQSFDQRREAIGPAAQFRQDILRRQFFDQPGEGIGAQLPRGGHHAAPGGDGVVQLVFHNGRQKARPGQGGLAAAGGPAEQQEGATVASLGEQGIAGLQDFVLASEKDVGMLRLEGAQSTKGRSLLLDVPDDFSERAPGPFVEQFGQVRPQALGKGHRPVEMVVGAGIGPRFGVLELFGDEGFDAFLLGDEFLFLLGALAAEAFVEAAFVPPGVNENVGSGVAVIFLRLHAGAHHEVVFPLGAAAVGGAVVLDHEGAGGTA